MISISPNASYGILLSGGLDSAILLGLLVKQNPNIKLQPFTINKVDGAMMYANPIIEHINKKFDVALPATIVVGDPTVHHRQQSVTAVKDIFDNHAVDILFNALNRNPPELNDLPGAPQRTTKSDDSRVVLPFVDMLKTEILQLMYDNNLEDLIEITHSCTERQMTRCGQCWQCTERAWAFSQLNKLDKGTF